MEFNDYQKKADETDQNPNLEGVDGIHIPLLGLAGEAGNLLTEYKKRLRDGEAHKLFPTQFKEELGDILWYISNIAGKLELNLQDVADYNLKKIEERWKDRSQKVSPLQNRFFDETYETDEQIPRKFIVHFKETTSKGKKSVKITMNDVQIGDSITDNSYNDDGYRYHDAFHFAYAAVLGWSPVVRSILKRKRKSRSEVDEVEDGARAAIIEEAISASVYTHARHHDLFRDIEILDYELLKSIKQLVQGFEVQVCTLTEWQKAILDGYRVFNQLVENRGGYLKINLTKREIKYSKKIPTR